MRKFLFLLLILLCSCTSEKIGYLGKSKSDILAEKGKPVEVEKGFKIYDEAIAYGKDFTEYEVFFFKKNKCFQHNQTFPKDKFNSKFEELKKSFGEPAKVDNEFLFYNGKIRLLPVKNIDREKITSEKLVFDGTGEKDTFSIIWGEL